MRFWWQTFIKTNPENDLAALTQSLRSAVGDRLKSMIVFGSWISGEFDRRHSNVNVLVVADLAWEALEAMRPALKPWLEKGHTPPVLVGTDDLDDFARDFPIEFLDMQDTHRVVFGQDVLTLLTVNKEHLKAQCEHDLAVVQLRLRQVAAGGNERLLKRVLAEAVPSILTLLHAALRLEENAAKLDRIKAAEALAGRLGLDAAVLRRLQALKAGEDSGPVKGLAAETLNLIGSVLDHLRKR